MDESEPYQLDEVLSAGILPEVRRGGFECLRTVFPRHEVGFFLSLFVDVVWSHEPLMDVGRQSNQGHLAL